ncbi:tripartite tricarboxylate transporter substrate binding protein [Ruegeria arenilitoris]|uniref:tripartite tricarboxylate transporter substrate binding protein n=1 Tax=Ruegeria arenilitoris TaxID=1173585 RepID=UPI00147B415D|nr:tripartite tricarboxylate transporter substrate binding protein [Ruegeria arenilitoris]
MKLKRTITGFVAGALMAFAGGAMAEDWEPTGTLRLQIGFAAGGSTDTMGRVIAKVMKEQTGWNIIAENKTGGGGVAMFTGIAKMPPKGNVIGLGVNMPVLINLVKRGDQLGFDLDSFEYLGTVSRAQLALIARADAPFDDLAGMIEYSKANDGLAIGFGAPPQKLLMEVVNREADANLRFVSTKGEAETQKLILGGQVMAGFSAGTHIKYLESGDFKMIASANDARHDYAPDVQTVREAGISAYLDPYFYFATTAGTDPAAVAALTNALENAMATDEVAEIVRNAATTEVLNLGAEGTEKMMVDGVENVKVLFGQ